MILHSDNRVNKINILNRKSYSLLLLFVFLLMICFFTILNKNYFSVNNLQSILSNASFKGILVVGELLVLLAGGIDLSIGSIVGFSTLTCLALNILLKMPLIYTIIIIVFIGFIFGLLNGILIKFIGINPIITTLSTSFIISSLGYLFQRKFLYLTDRPRIEGTSFAQVADGFVWVIPKVFIYPLVLFIIIVLILKFTTFGRSLFIAGAGNNLAEIIGFKVKKIQITTYILSGICASLAGLLLSSQLLTGRPQLGADSTIDILIIVILGGTLITGGKTDIFGVFITWILIESLANGLVMINTPYYLRQSFTGLLLIVSMIINSARRREIIFKI